MFLIKPSHVNYKQPYLWSHHHDRLHIKWTCTLNLQVSEWDKWEQIFRNQSAVLYHFDQFATGLEIFKIYEPRSGIGAKNNVKPYFLTPLWCVTSKSNETVQYMPAIWASPWGPTLSPFLPKTWTPWDDSSWISVKLIITNACDRDLTLSHCQSTTTSESNVYRRF